MTLHEFDLLPPTLQHVPYQIGENPDLLFGPFKPGDVGEGDYFNHSCNPNAGFRGTQMLVAMKAIATGQQVTFDYAICMTGAFGDMPCQCGDRNCRQFISGNDWKIPSLQRAYRGYWQPYIQEKIDALRLPRRMKSR